MRTQKGGGEAVQFGQPPLRLFYLFTDAATKPILIKPASPDKMEASGSANEVIHLWQNRGYGCLLYTSPSPRD